MGKPAARNHFRGRGASINSDFRGSSQNFDLFSVFLHQHWTIEVSTSGTTLALVEAGKKVSLLLDTRETSVGSIAQRKNLHTNHLEAAYATPSQSKDKGCEKRKEWQLCVSCQAALILYPLMEYIRLSCIPEPLPTPMYCHSSLR